MPTYSYHCDCGSETSHTCEYSKRPEIIICDGCGHESAMYAISAPNVMRTALPDGTKRKGWAEMREASKMNKQAAVAQGETKKELVREINKIAKIRKEGI